ncbi:hypothetical protein PRNP1_011827 [Phytophthora ramorum]
MRRSQLVSIVRGLLPPDSTWPDNHSAPLKEDKTVLMLVAAVPDPRLAVKLIDFACPHTVNFWARDARGRHVVMDACARGVHLSVLQRLVKWARKERYDLVAQVSKRDSDGFDAVELAVQRGHGALAAWLLNQRVPSTYYASLCPHYPLEVLELTIESGHEECVRSMLANERVVADLQPELTDGLNRRVRWLQRRATKKRLFNIYTCVGAAVRRGMAEVVTAIYKVNPQETHQAVWYAVAKLQSKSPDVVAELPPLIRRMARSYLLDKSWAQLHMIVLLRQWKLLNGRTRSSWKQMKRLWRRERRDWDAILSHPLSTLPSEMITLVLGFLLPSERAEMKETRFLAEY